MGQKESEKISIDNEFMSKYLRDDSKDSSGAKKDEGEFLQRFEARRSGTIEVFSKEGEGDLHSEDDTTRFKKKYTPDDSEFDEFDEKIEVEKGPVCEEKKEFLKHLQDDSLSIDTCANVSHDWKRG